MRLHLIAGGEVRNTINWGGDLESAETAYPDFTVIEAVEGGPGWAWDGETLTQPAPPPEPVPDQITNAQARAMLLTLPTVSDKPSLFHDVDDHLRAQKELSTQDAINWQFWEYGNNFSRRGPLMTTLAVDFGYTDPAALDAIFIAASKLDV